MPTPVLTPNATTATSLTVNVAGLEADGTLQVQYGIRADFLLGVAPVVENVARASPVVVTGLNPGTAYYVRIRSKTAAGVIGAWSNVLGAKTAAGAARDVSPAAVMIQPALLVVPTPVLSWTDVNAATIAGFPLANLDWDAPVAWRSLAPAGTHVFAAEVGNAPVDTIALLMSNASTAAQVTVKAGPTTAGAAYSFGPVTFRASANLPGRPGYHALIQLPAAQEYRYWRVQVTDATLFGNVFHLEHAIFGVNRTTKNHSVDKSESVIDYGSLDRNRVGAPQRTLGARLRRVDFDISLLTEAQYEVAYGDLDRLVGQTEPVLCVPNSKAGAFLHDRILYGCLSGGKTVNPASPRYTRSFTVESLL